MGKNGEFIDYNIREKKKYFLEFDQKPIQSIL